MAHEGLHHLIPAPFPELTSRLTQPLSPCSRILFLFFKQADHVPLSASPILRPLSEIRFLLMGSFHRLDLYPNVISSEKPLLLL